MKLNRIAIAACAMLSLAAAPASAQGLGGLIKKAKQIIAPESKAATTATTQAAGKKGTLTVIDGGGTLRNPLASIVDVQLVGAYGKSTSANYGVVTLVFKVKMIANLNQLRLGGNSNYPAIMVDQDDNAYKMRVGTGWYSYDVKREQRVCRRQEDGHHHQAAATGHKHQLRRHRAARAQQRAHSLGRDARVVPLGEKRAMQGTPIEPRAGDP